MKFKKIVLKKEDGGWRCYGPGGDGGGSSDKPKPLLPTLIEEVFPVDGPTPPDWVPANPPDWKPFPIDPYLGGGQPGAGGSNNINEIIRQIKFKVSLNYYDEQYLTINPTAANDLLEIIQSDSENEALVISTRLALSVLKNNSFNSEDILREYNVYHNQNYIESDPISSFNFSETK